MIGTAVAERGCSHDLARAALAEAAKMRAHYTVVGPHPKPYTLNPNF
jgi:hypothetical protein